jgi:mRNA-capping enzyme
MAVNIFSEARPPGIYKEEYVRELFKRYADPSLDIPLVPELPTWEQDDKGNLSDDDGGGDDFQDSNQGAEGSSGDSQDFNKNKNKNRNKRSRKEESKLNPQFAEPELKGVETCTDPDEITRVRRETQSICDWNG